MRAKRVAIASAVAVLASAYILIPPGSATAAGAGDDGHTVLWRGPTAVHPAPRPALPQPARPEGSRDQFTLIATLPHGVSNICEGDLDHNGRKELWFADMGAVYAWEATADNTFVLVHSAPAPPSGVTIFLGIGDTDGDGLQELIWKAGSAGDPYLVFCEQPDPYTFPSAPTAEYHTGVENTHYAHLRVVDTDGDGVNELVCTDQGTSGRSLAIYDAFADNSYREAYWVHYGNSGTISGCIGVDDFDQDGYLELAVPEVSDQVRVHVIKCLGHNEYVESWTSDWFPDPNGQWVTEGGDLDRDGKRDFVLVTGNGGFTEPTVWTAWLLEAVGNDEYETVWSYQITGGFYGFMGGAVAGDVNGDGYNELLFQAGSAHTIVFAGRADNTLEPIWSLEGPVDQQGRCRLITTDLDRDGRPELVWYTDTATVIYEYVPGSSNCTYTVRPDGSGDFPTIQAAIDAAPSGAVICLGDGTFTRAGNRDIDFRGKALTVKAQSNNPAACVIDCGNSGRGFQFVTGETAASTLTGVTIRNGTAPEGGAIYCQSSAPTISRCVISGNYATVSGGGGIYSAGGSPDIEHCTISGNRAAQYGGGIFGACVPHYTIVWGNCADQGGDEWYGAGAPPVAACCNDINAAGLDGFAGSPVTCGLTPDISVDPLFCNPQPCAGAPTPEGTYTLRAGSPCENHGSCGQIGARGVECQACCLPPPALCCDTEILDCVHRGGFPLGAEDSCTGQPEACCLDGGTCELMEPACCLAHGGLPQGAGSSCTTTVCREACCLGSGACSNLPPSECLPAGQPQGVGTVCLGDLNGNGHDDACEGFAACCLPDGTCIEVRPEDCPFGGLPHGPGSYCRGDDNGNGVDDVCESLQACCRSDGTCTDVPPAECLPDGIPQGPGSQCLADENHNGVNDVCEPEQQCTDQSCTSMDGGARSIYAYMPIGQEFVPAAPAHWGVQLLVYDAGGTMVSLTVKIHVGTITGPVVPNTTITRQPPSGGGWVLFPFSQAVYLEPGTTYVLEVTTTGYRWMWYFSGGLCYPPGQGYVNGYPAEDDYAFSTRVACLDCNGNGVPDNQDILNGTTPDCNENGYPDACDIAAGRSCDRNGNAVPDECESPVRRGDLNCDGRVDFGDINPFVMILCNPGLWQTTYPGCALLNGDINCDGSVNFGDINPFVGLMGQ